MKKVSVEEILQKIYDSEINFSLGWMWDGGVDYKIGSDLYYIEGYVKSTGYDKIYEALNVIADEIVKEYPNSEFAKWWSVL